MFEDKARNVQMAGAIGLIVAQSSKAHDEPIFLMAGSGKPTSDPVRIGSVMVKWSDAARIESLMKGADEGDGEATTVSIFDDNKDQDTANNIQLTVAPSTGSGRGMLRRLQVMGKTNWGVTVMKNKADWQLSIVKSAGSGEVAGRGAGDGQGETHKKESHALGMEAAPGSSQKSNEGGGGTDEER